MARTVSDSRLKNRTQRGQLSARGKPYWMTLYEGLHLGYRKNKTGGRWVVRWYDHSVKKYATSTIGTADDSADSDGITVFDFKQAQSLAREMSTRMAARKKGVRIGPYTVSDALEDYFESSDNDAINIDADRRRAELYIIPLIGDKKLDDLTRDGVKQWRDKIATMPPFGRGGKPRHEKVPQDETERKNRERARKDSANRVFSTLKAALNFAFDEGKTTSDQAWRRVAKFDTTTKARVRYFSMPEVTRLINAAEPDFRDLVRGALMTGARYGDLCAMDVADFNHDAGVVMSGNSKSSKPHTVYLTDEGAAFFARITAGRSGTEPMFTKSNGQRWRRSEQLRPMKYALEAANIDPPASFYTLRHTYCSHALMGGTSMLVVAGNLGHSDTRMVEKHYGHLAKDYRADAIRGGVPTWGGVDDSKVVSL